MKVPVKPSPVKLISKFMEVFCWPDEDNRARCDICPFATEEGKCLCMVFKSKFSNIDELINQ